MWKSTSQVPGGTRKFFLAALAHESLYNYYKTNFALMQFHKYSITEIENMMPFEREIYVAMLMQHMEEEKNKQRAG